ncbi:conserved exported hypothetical protein [Thiocapsa sp. KS1]|nr:hypothetical protein [Thiocapsa sp. KS1]CRI64366.1 conserved exported hypothetical protein [Thiocapsa sp. KS1]
MGRSKDSKGRWKTPRVAPGFGRGLVALLLAALLTTPAGVGCAVVEKDRRAVGLQAATSGYQSALRWGYYDTALGFLPPDQRKSGAIPEIFAELRVTGYDVAQPPIIQADDSATQIVVIDYLFEDAQVVKQLTDRQVWRWDDRMGTWWLHSGLPKFARGGTGRTTR